MTIESRGQRRCYYSPRRRLHRTLPTALALALAAAFPSSAFDLEYEIGVDLMYSDNINLTEAAASEDDTVVAPTMRFDISQAGADVQLSGHGLVQYTEYLNDTFSDEFRGGFSGALEWAVVPSRLDLVFQNYLTQQRIDDLDRSTPDNLQQVNLFVAGPSMYARFSPVTRGQFDLRYGNTYAEESDAFDGDRLTAAARVRHEISPTSEITGNLEAAAIEYDQAGSAADYDRYDAYVSQTFKRSAFDFSLDIGYSHLDQQGGDDSSSSPLVRGTAIWTMSPRSRLRANLRYQFTDATQYLITPTLDFGDRYFSDVSYTDLIVQPYVFRERSARMAYEFTGDRTSLRLQPYYRRIGYFNPLAEDQRLKGLAFDIEHRLRPLLSVSLLAIHEQTDYEDLSRSDKDTRVEIGMNKRFTRHWSGRMGIRYRERNTSVPGGDYKENVALLSITYTR